MNYISSTHYFESVEKYLHSANGVKPLQALEEFVKKDGAQAEIVDTIVNGALQDFIFDCVPAPNDFVQVYGPDGKAVYVKKIEMTFDQWATSLTNTILGIKRERIDAILENMCDKGILVKSQNNSCLYRGKAPIRRNLLKI